VGADVPTDHSCGALGRPERHLAVHGHRVRQPSCGLRGLPRALQRRAASSSSGTHRAPP
jgi:hypothetical protein